MTSRTAALVAPLMLAALLVVVVPASKPEAAGATPAGAAGLPFTVGVRVRANAKAGPVNVIAVTATAPATTRCTLQISAAHLEKTLPSRELGNTGWRWTVPHHPPQGVWRFTVICREGVQWAGAWYQGEMGFPERSGALIGASAGRRQASGESCDSQGVCFTNDPFPTGQCTWYAAGRRADLVGVVHGAARKWLAEAKGHVPEGSRPALGAIAVFGSSSPGSPGHVAYVAAISGSRVLLDDSNWRSTPWSPWLQVHEHWEPARGASGYIYGGPAGTGPRPGSAS